MVNPHEVICLIFLVNAFGILEIVSIPRDWAAKISAEYSRLSQNDFLGLSGSEELLE